MSSIIFIFLIFFAVELLTKTVLEILNISKANSCKDIPDYFKKEFSADVFKKMRQYTVSKGKLSLFSLFFQSILLMLFIFSGFFGTLEQFILAFIGNNHPYLGGIVFIYTIFLIITVLSLPISIYSEFAVEKRFGFSKITPALFAADFLKSLLISGIIFFPLLLMLFMFMDKAGSFWWLYAFGFTVLFQLTVSCLYPVVIAPLFNKFKLLDNDALSQCLFSLASQLDFKVGGIFKMDGSRRSSHSNAYFTGFGKMRRIVLFDTLIELLNINELKAVLAHEIGHYKKHHLIKGLLLAFSVMFAGFYVLNLLLGWENLYKAFGFESSSYYGIIILIALYSNPFTFFLSPVFNIFSRRNEYEADRFAVNALNSDVVLREATEQSGAEYLKNALYKLGRENLSNPIPHSLYSFFHYSHPALFERLSAIDNLKN